MPVPDHKWDELDALVGLYLTKFYEENRSAFKQDVLLIRLRNAHPTMKPNSMGMAISNFRYLLGWGGKLSSYSNLAEEVFKKYNYLTLEELKAEIDKRFNEINPENI